MLAMTGFTVTRAVIIIVAGSLLRVKELCATHDFLVRKRFLFSRSENILFVKLQRFLKLRKYKFLQRLYQEVIRSVN
jgi:hypothetical protein